MRILTVADEPSPILWGPKVREHLAGIDLILSCGDLPPEYLEYLVTFTKAPLLYVHGNHDGRHREREPEGCICVEDKVVMVSGLRILGLGGSIRYNREGRHQYTQEQMRRRVWRQSLALYRAGGLDVLLTHSAAFGLGDGEDRAHTGFTAFRDVLDRWKPGYFIHGHSHLNYDYRQKRVDVYGPTTVVNAYERFVLETGEQR